MRRIWIAVACVAGLVGSGCGKATIKAGGAAKSVAQIVKRQTGYVATDVKCPSGVEAKVGKIFDCHFTGPDGKYTATLRITAIKGERVNFDIQSRRD